MIPSGLFHNYLQSSKLHSLELLGYLVQTRQSKRHLNVWLQWAMICGSSLFLEHPHPWQTEARLVLSPLATWGLPSRNMGLKCDTRWFVFIRKIQAFTGTTMFLFWKSSFLHNCCSFRKNHEIIFDLSLWKFDDGCCREVPKYRDPLHWLRNDSRSWSPPLMVGDVDDQTTSGITIVRDCSDRPLPSVSYIQWPKRDVI